MIALEELHLHRDVVISPEMLFDLLLDVQANSPLTVLTLLLFVYFPSEDPLKPISSLLNQLESFTCSNAITIPLNSGHRAIEFNRLEEFNVEMGLAMSANAPEIPQLKSLILRNGYIWPRPLRAYTSVTSLAIHLPLARSGSLTSERSSFDMPQLKDLLLDGSWAYVQGIMAPKLDTLTLRGVSKRKEFREDHLRKGSIHIRPRILHIDKAISEKALVDLLRDNWNCVEELHLTTMKNGEGIGRTLMNAILGFHRAQPACPNLTRLSIKYPVMGEDTNLHTHEMEREEIVKSVKSIIEAKRNADQLLHVFLGWYPATTETVHRDKGDSWNVEWRQIL
jgi:hypothetical protein